MPDKRATRAIVRVFVAIGIVAAVAIVISPDTPLRSVLVLLFCLIVLIVVALAWPNDDASE